MFVRDDRASPDGTALYTILPDLTLDQLTRAFGPPTNDPGEEDKGYRHQYVFRSSDGVIVTLYDRFGVWRIGAKTPASGQSFAGWLPTALTAGPALDTARMIYVPGDKKLVAEASDHPLTRAGSPPTVPVRSHRTGAVVTFRRVGPVYAGNPPDREVVATVYRHDPTGTELHILND